MNYSNSVCPLKFIQPQAAQMLPNKESLLLQTAFYLSHRLIKTDGWVKKRWIRISLVVLPLMGMWMRCTESWAVSCCPGGFAAAGATCESPCITCVPARMLMTVCSEGVSGSFTATGLLFLFHVCPDADAWKAPPPLQLISPDRAAASARLRVTSPPATGGPTALCE